MFANIYAASVNETWAINQHWLTAAISQAKTATPSRSTKLPKVTGNVAILPLHGMISQRASIWQEIFGGTSTQAFGAAYTRAVNDDRIQAIVFDVDSPGGTTSGVEELSDIIEQGSKIKTTVAVANSQAASAAYWLASQVGPGKFFASPGSDVGSIGVFRMHEDVSEMLAKDGVKVSFLAVPEYKTEANPYEPLSEEAREYHLGQVQSTYDQFLKDVARGRSVIASRVAKDYGRGRMFQAQQATDVGMVDGVKTLAQVLAQLGVGTGKAQVGQIASNPVEEMLCEAWNMLLPVAMVPKPDKTVRERRLFDLTGRRI